MNQWLEVRRVTREIFAGFLPEESSKRCYSNCVVFNSQGNIKWTAYVVYKGWSILLVSSLTDDLKLKNFDLVKKGQVIYLSHCHFIR